MAPTITPVSTATTHHAVSGLPQRGDFAVNSLARRTATAYTPLTRTVTGGGKDPGSSPAEYFERLAGRFDAKAAKDADQRFLFRLSGKGGGTWYVEVKKGKITVKKGSGPNPTVTVRCSASDYMKMEAGKMNRILAFMTGRVKLDGNLLNLKRFYGYFED